MPLLKFDLIEGRSSQQIKELLDAAHRAVLNSFNVPARDRYQIVTEHKDFQMEVQDTSLGIDRSKNLVVLTVITSPRSEESKQSFYAELARQLEARCDINPSDLVVSIISNSKSDWSFGNGIAQYLTGEL